MTAKKRGHTTTKTDEPRPVRTTTPLLGSRATLISVLVIAAAGLIFFWRVVFLGEILTGGDVLAAAAIFEHYAQEQMAGGNLPLWNPYIFSGMPFFDSMSWSAFVYPSYWIKFVLEKIPGVQLPRLFFLFLHYELAAVGTFFYLRSRKVGHIGAAVAGIAFMLSPHLVGLATIGHGGKVMASAYLPLVLMAAHRVIERGERRWIAILGLVGGLQFLARHVQVSYYTWLAVLVLIVCSVVMQKRSGTEGRALASRAAAVVAGGVLAVLLASILLIPLQAYSEFSTRAAESGGMGFENATMWSLHPKELLTFLVPSMFGLANETYWGTMPFQQVSHYVGYVVLCLAALALVRRRGDVTFLLVLAAVGIFMAFGRHIGPVYRALYTILPGFSRFRVPAMALMLSQFSLAALAGYGTSVVLGEREERRLSWLKWGAGLAAVGVVVGLIVLMSQASMGRAAVTALMTKHAGAPIAALRDLGAQAASLAVKDAILLLAFALATGFAVFLSGTRRIPKLVAAVLILGLVVADVAIVDARFMDPEKMRPLSGYYPETPAISYLKQQEGVFRVAPVGRGFASNEWMYHRIESVGGYHPAKLAVTEKLLSNVGVGNLKLLALLNVRYIVGAEGLDHPAFREVAPGVYENLAALPRVFLVGNAKRVSRESVMLMELNIDNFNPAETATYVGDLPGPVESTEGSTAELVSYEPQELRVRASIQRPCLLMFSEVYYPLGWKAYVDDVETTIYRADYALRSVYLEPGEHTVVMRYEPSNLRLGLFLSLLGLVCIAGLAWWPERRAKGGSTA